MNYAAHYGKLIERARNRLLGGYVEVHHVTPKCMGGSGDVSNLVQLTAEEHFVAHQLLHKMYPHVRGLTFALISMTGNRYGYRSNKAYGWIRRKHADAVSEKSKEMWQDPEYRAKHKAAMDEVRARPGYGEQFSRIHKGRVKSAQERANISAARKGVPTRKFSEQARANMAAARRKTWAERRANGTDKLAAAKAVATRRANGSYNFSDEWRANIGKAGIGRKVTPEQRAKISESMKAYRAATRH